MRITKRGLIAGAGLVLGVGLLYWVCCVTAPAAAIAGFELESVALDNRVASDSDADGITASPDRSVIVVSRTESSPDPIRDLARALRQGSGLPAAAAALRGALRKQAAARSACLERIRAASTPSDLRAVLILVLGTIDTPDVDRILLETIWQFGRDSQVVVAAIHALGAERTPADADDVFDLADRPWGVRGPGGLGITVHRAITDAAVIRRIAAHLFDRDREVVRRAAVTTLRHSVGRDQVRSEFRSALGHEVSDQVASGLGEALAGWACDQHGQESNAVLDELVERGETAGFDGYRFHIENELRGATLTDRARQRLSSYLQPGNDFAVRAWALEVLGDQRGTTRLLCRIAKGDHDPAIRDAAARLLGRGKLATTTLQTLQSLLMSDRAWRVRYAALESLAGGPRAVVLPALRKARHDPDRRVAARAAVLAR